MKRGDLHDIILKPVISEKATGQSQLNRVVFETPMHATKPAIRKAVETVFKVKVLSVNTLIQKGKRMRFRGRAGRQSDRKKAIVRLAEGSRIDLAEGAKD